MLSLSLRGFGLLVLVAPTYRKRRHARKRLPLACPPINTDLLKDARSLYASGHHVAAAMTARVEIERQLTLLAMTRPDFGNEWRGVTETAGYLGKKRVLRTRVYKAVIAANATGNLAAHGKGALPQDVLNMFGVIDGLRSAVARHAKGGVA